MSSTQSKFPSASREDWHALVSAALKGGDPQSLDRLDEDGLAIKALYDIASYAAASSDACAVTRLPVNPASHIAHLHPNVDRIIFCFTGSRDQWGFELLV